jgi:hypothetical protein
MKKLTLLLIVVAVCNAVAQPKKGDLYFGGALSYSFSKNTSDDTKQDSYQVYPMASFYLNEKMAVGAGISFAGNSSTYAYPTSTGDVDLTDCQKLFSFAPFFRMHSKFFQTVSCYADAGFQIGFGNEKQACGREFGGMQNQILPLLFSMDIFTTRVYHTNPSRMVPIRIMLIREVYQLMEIR